MEKRKNLCAMIPETLHTKIRDEQERKELTLSVTYQNRCQKEDLSENKRVEPGNVGKPRNIKGFPDILILKKALCDINFEKKAEILCYIKVKMENPTLMHRKG